MVSGYPSGLADSVLLHDGETHYIETQIVSEPYDTSLWRACRSTGNVYRPARARSTRYEPSLVKTLRRPGYLEMRRVEAVRRAAKRRGTARNAVVGCT